jgi:hypothetical protein
MIRRMRDRRRAERENAERENAELEALLTGAWEHAAEVAGRFLDLDAGLAALLATARQESRGDAAAQAGGALGVVLARADAMLAAVTAHLEPDQGPAHSHIMMFLHASRQYLLQLRSGLAGRSIGKDSAWQQLAGLDHALKEAGRTLAALPAGPVTDDERYDLGALLAAVRAQIPDLTARIERLFDDAGHPSIPVPAR